MEDQDQFDKFPDEILLHIFSFMPTKSIIRSSRVYKRWQQISKDRKLWQSTVQYTVDDIKSGELEAVLARGCSTLELGQCKYHQPVFASRGPQASCDLERLTTHLAEMPPQDVRLLVEKAPNVEEILLGKCVHLTGISLGSTNSRRLQCLHTMGLTFPQCQELQALMPQVSILVAFR